MDAAQVYTEVMQAGERLIGALANAREANVHNGSTTWRTWLYRLRSARREVEHAAEQYACALRAFREATEAEFVPHLEKPQPPVVSRHADCLHPSARGNGRNHARASRKEPGTETSSLAPRQSKSK